VTLDAITFIETVLVNPETDAPFVLTAVERGFLRHAFELTPDGRLRFPEEVFSTPKKGGKTAFAAMVLLYVVRVLGGRFGEGYCCANDFEQSQGRVFLAAARIVEASPMVAADAIVTASKITFISTGATITAIASDFAGAAGGNPTITVFDELWGYTSERSRRLWDEMVPPPTRKIACRLTVTYAGFEGESELLEGLYRRGLLGEQLAPDLYAAGGLLMFWTHDFVAPWQTEEWREQMREQHRPNAYLRQIENRWVTSESPFIDMDWFDECVDPAATPLISHQELPVWVGVDASTKRDSTAVAACTWDDRTQKVRLVFHRIFQPSLTEPLDFEATIEATVLELARRFRLIEVRYDPYQMQSTAQRLQARHVPMVEFAQTQANLTEASTNLFELVKGRNFVAYPDAAVRLAVQRSIAVETSRGWRIAKEKASHKIDVVVALAQAALGAVHSVTAPATLWARGDLLVDDAPIPVPTRAETIFASIALDDIRVAVCYWATAGRHHRAPLVLLDYVLAPFTAGLFSSISTRLDELFAQQEFGRYLGHGSQGAYGPMVMAEPTLAEYARAAGLPTTPVDERMLADRAELARAIAPFVAAGNVKIAEPAWERSQTAPLPLLDVRAAADAHPSAPADAALIGLACALPENLRFWERIQAHAA
jgi:hypothetical protein